MPMNSNQDYANNPPWYMTIQMPGYKNENESSLINRNIYFDPLSDMQHEKIDQADRLLNHTAKALLTRTSLERSHSRERDDEISQVRNHLAQFSDMPFGVNQARDGMRWSMEQNLMALSREDRQAQMSFWNDLWTMSRELLTCVDSHEKLNRRKNMMNPPVIEMMSQIP